jgi:hypothetical protein
MSRHDGRLGNPRRLARLLGIAEALPEIDITPHGDHQAFRVRKKTFAYFHDNHHGDGLVAICCKSSLDRRDELVARYPGRYYVPAYLGPRGWVALRIDLPEIDWDEVADLLFTAYRLQAPRRLADQV